MRLNDSTPNSPRATRQTTDREYVSISQLINEIVFSLSEHFVSSRITVELDVQPLEVYANLDLIRSAMKSLMRNAMSSMRRGGELSVTLIDSPHQWELEVADTSTNRLVEASIQKEQFDPESDVGDESSTVNMECESLAEVHAAADAHGGHVQTWNCPSGGTANVLIVPKRHRNAA